jgi:hypothetical protein
VIASVGAAEQRGAAPSRVPRVCVLVPVTPPAYPLERIYTDFSAPLRAAGEDFEFLFVLPGAAPDLLGPLRRLQEEGEPLRMVVTGSSPPESVLAEVARAHTASPVLVTLPSYPRVEPRALVDLIASLGDDVDLVTGARVNRGDPLVNRVQRRLFHALLGTMVGGRFEDIASGVRAMRREVLEEIDLYGDHFRFIPMLATRDGFRVIELRVQPHEGDRRTRVYAPGIYVRRAVDLVGLMLLVRFTYKPLRFFGLLGSAVAGVGAVILLVLAVERLGGRGIADRPMLLLGVLLVVLGIQALALGLIGEIVVHHNVAKRPTYRLRGTDKVE